MSLGSPSAQSALRRAVTVATPILERISDADAARPRAPGKWSRKEIVGHLIDSASVNLMRDYVAHLAHHLTQIVE